MLRPTEQLALLAEVPIPEPTCPVARRAEARAIASLPLGGATLYAPRGRLGPLMLPGVRHARLDIPVGLSAPERAAAVATEAAPLLDDRRPALIHCLGLEVALQAVLRRRFGAKVIVEPGVTPSQRLRDTEPTLPAERLETLVSLEDRVLRHADAVVVPSPTAAATFRKRGVSPERLIVIPDGVIPLTAGPTPSLPHLLALCDEGPASGVHTLLSAAARLKQPFRLSLLFPREVSLGALEREVRRLGLEARIDLGRLEDQDVKLPAALAVICPLDLGRAVEAGGLVSEAVLAGLAAGRPLVAPNLPAIRAYAGGAARYFEPSDPGTLAQALAEVISDHRLREQLEAEALAQRGRLSWLEATLQLQALWRGLLDA